MAHRVGDKVTVQMTVKRIDTEDNTLLGTTDSGLSLWVRERDVMTQPATLVQTDPVFNVGDLVVHVGCPEWGIGKVDHLVEDGQTTRLDFDDDGNEIQCHFTGQWVSVRYPNRQKRYISAGYHLRKVDASVFQVGDRVKHINRPNWGIGTITKVDPRHGSDSDYISPTADDSQHIEDPGIWYGVRYNSSSWMDYNWFSPAKFLTRA